MMSWLADRFGFATVREYALERRVARSPWYYGDGATLMLLLGVQVLTGVMMTLTYAPTPDAAYDSVVRITEQQRAGWFIRGLHYWSAGLMVVMLVIHLLRQILVGGYKFPREGTWLVGVGLFISVTVMAFTGYVLRWDETGLYALKVALHMFNNVPLIGDRLVVFVQGGWQIGPQTLTRIYAVHVLIVPLVMFLLVGWHLYLVMLHGVTSMEERRQSVQTAEEQRELYEEQAESKRMGEVFFPETAAKSGAMAVVVLLIAIGLTLLFGPPRLEAPANLTERSFPAEEWWFAWYSGLIALLPPRIAPAVMVLFPIVLLILLVLLPFIDRSEKRGIRRRPWAMVTVVLIAIALLYLTDLRRRSPWTAWPDPNPPPVPVNVELGPEAEHGRLLFAQFGCNTCHPVAGAGRQFGPDLARPPRLLSRAEMRDFILQPPEGAAMPAYAGRISEEQLERLLDFVHAAQLFPLE